MNEKEYYRNWILTDANVEAVANDKTVFPVTRSLAMMLISTRKELNAWQQFAGYCRSCALSGESDPMDFEAFKKYMEQQPIVKKVP